MALRILFCFLLSCFGAKTLESQTIRPYMKAKDRVFYTYSYAFINSDIHSYEQSWRSNENLIQLFLESKISQQFFLGYGLGYNSTNIHHNLRISGNPIGSENLFEIIPDSVNYSRNKLNVKYLEVPIEVRFRRQTEKGRIFRVSLGAKAGYRINSYSRYKDDFENVAYYNIEELNRWNYGVYTRIGYGLFSFYASYNISPLFHNLSDEKANWADRNTLSFGLSIGG